MVLVTSDAHQSLVDALAATLPGASWQRCRTHFMRNLLTRVPKAAQPAVATMVRSIIVNGQSNVSAGGQAKVSTLIPSSSVLPVSIGPPSCGRTHLR